MSMLMIHTSVIRRFIILPTRLRKNSRRVLTTSCSESDVILGEKYNRTKVCWFFITDEMKTEHSGPYRKYNM